MFRSSFLAVFLGTMALGASCDISSQHPTTSRTFTTQAPSVSASVPVPARSESAAPNPSAAQSTTSPPPPDLRTLEDRLDKLAITDQHFAQQELYSWTTPDQVERLRHTKTLLVATAKTRGVPSPYSRLLTRLSNGTGASRDVAKLLSEHPGLTKRRYAWPTPFATAVPLGERSYGHALIRIVLKDESFVAKLDPLDKNVFSFVDLANNIVAITEAIAHPERIAMVFHVRRKPEGGSRFREYVICNESMISNWSISTAHERAVVAENAALVSALLRSPLVNALDKNSPLDAASTWSSRPDKPTLLDAWRRSLAFDSPKYKPSPATLEAIATSLAAYDGTGEPLEHKPSVDFPNSP